jgi:hypothetical protein
MELKEAGWKDEEWNFLAQDRKQWQAFVSVVMDSEISDSHSNKYEAFWDVLVCSLVEIYQCFSGMYWLNHQGDES